MRNMESWVKQNFDAIPTHVVGKLMFDYDSVWELDDPKLDDEEIMYKEALPMWGTMWVLNPYMQNNLGEEEMRAIWDNGFRLYDSEDLEYVIGIDGAGYDFYEAHWEGLREGLEGAMR